MGVWGQLEPPELALYTRAPTFTSISASKYRYSTFSGHYSTLFGEIQAISAPDCPILFTGLCKFPDSVNSLYFSSMDEEISFGGLFLPCQAQICYIFPPLQANTGHLAL